MAKIRKYVYPLDDTPVYICHVGLLGHDPSTSWHMVFDGLPDDIYWFMAFTGGNILWVPASVAPLYAKSLTSLPQIPRDICGACWYQTPPLDYFHPMVPRWDIYRGQQQPCPVSIYWPHPYEYDNNPPGFYYPWQ